jgi:hypothetical protein
MSVFLELANACLLLLFTLEEVSHVINLDSCVFGLICVHLEHLLTWIEAF